MPKFKQTSEIVRLSGRKDLIRNVGILAHVDHGKTTLTDSLLTDAGFLPPQLIGTAKVLDYLEEEHRRGITIKTANISFMHKAGDNNYLINLVDTPGHVDFSGKVMRALHTIDGAVIVVDAAEEIKAQTEAVLTQALKERVKPALFVNKVDRLTNEMKLSSHEMRQKFQRIINEFNSIIERHGEPPFKDSWKVDPMQGNVVFGSALQNWGFTVKTAEKHGLTLSNPQSFDKRSIQTLSETVPLNKAIFDMIVKTLPSPKVSQKYRIPKIWKGETDSEIGSAMLDCSDDGPAVMFVAGARLFQDEKLILTGRMFAGTLRGNDDVCLIGVNKPEKVEKVYICMGPFLEEVEQISSGNIGAISGVESANIGETLVDAGHADSAVAIEDAGHVSEPVMIVTVEPKDPTNLDRFVEGLAKLSIEDPALGTTADKESGQYMISGAGELHLEVALKLLKHHLRGIEFSASEPFVSYREGVRRKGAIALTKTPSQKCQLRVQVEPLTEDIVNSLEARIKIKLSELENAVRTEDEQEVLDCEEHGNMLVVAVADTNVQKIRSSLVSGFRWACRTGPLCEQPLRGVRVTLEDASIDEITGKRESDQIARAMSRAILGSFLTAKPVMLEPLYSIEVSTPTQWFAACADTIRRRRGRIVSTLKKDISMLIRGHIPVAETLGLANALRSATSGYASWQLAFAGWKEVPEKLAIPLTSQLRQKRGLPADVPKPQTLVDEIT